MAGCSFKRGAQERPYFRRQIFEQILENMRRTAMWMPESRALQGAGCPSRAAGRRELLAPSRSRSGPGKRSFCLSERSCRRAWTGATRPDVTLYRDGPGCRGSGGGWELGAHRRWVRYVGERWARLRQEQGRWREGKEQGSLVDWRWVPEKRGVRSDFTIFNLHG